MLKRTPLYDQHAKLGAKLAPFAGWEMPISYKGIIDEHNTVRNSVGIFDIGHMGLIKVEGNDALALIQKTTTNDAARLEMNSCQYAIICNEQGGAIDDVLVYRLPMMYLIVANASNADKVLSWLKAQAKKLKSVTVGRYENYSMLSVQGPQAVAMTEQVLSVKLTELKRNHTLWWRDIILSRTGYTGEDGIELIAAKSDTPAIWQKFLAAGAQPCGLGARDTLRLEAGLPLYGHEYDEQTSPLEVGYAWAVKFDKGDFIGRAALLRQKEQGPKKKLFGLRLNERSIARAGDAVLTADGKEIGKVSSGTFSPSLKQPVALAFLATDQAAAGQKVKVNIRQRSAAAEVVAKTFYKR
ncbi:MAG: glycine cleavage system aminomethyltransferase GcvT [Candidatus Saganbacteria bacterium]|nr:glycine cleavage system aminomethyltransferase GcvT [Candidatus Saganbacteria bacterium]